LGRRREKAATTAMTTATIAAAAMRMPLIDIDDVAPGAPALG
jgi:hypothetical protein